VTVSIRHLSHRFTRLNWLPRQCTARTGRKLSFGRYESPLYHSVCLQRFHQTCNNWHFLLLWSLATCKENDDIGTYFSSTRRTTAWTGVRVVTYTSQTTNTCSAKLPWHKHKIQSSVHDTAPRVSYTCTLTRPDGRKDIQHSPELCGLHSASELYRLSDRHLSAISSANFCG
jgi:hypothetical protein